MNITFGNNPVTLVGNPISQGDPLPEFELTARDLSPVTKKDLKLPALFLTFPSVDTSVCSLELLTFNDKLEGLGYHVYGVSVDTPFALDRFVKTNAGENIEMLSDYKDHNFGEATGTLVDEFKILARTSFFVDPEGKVTEVTFLPEIGDEPNYDAILEAAKNIL